MVAQKSNSKVIMINNDNTQTFKFSMYHPLAYFFNHALTPRDKANFTNK